MTIGLAAYPALVSPRRQAFSAVHGHICALHIRVALLAVLAGNSHTSSFAA